MDLGATDDAELGEDVGEVGAWRRGCSRLRAPQSRRRRRPRPVRGSQRMCDAQHRNGCLFLLHSLHHQSGDTFLGSLKRVLASSRHRQGRSHAPVTTPLISGAPPRLASDSHADARSDARAWRLRHDGERHRAQRHARRGHDSRRRRHPSAHRNPRAAATRLRLVPIRRGARSPDLGEHQRRYPDADHAPRAAARGRLQQ